jgi:hypothetical protein
MSAKYGKIFNNQLTEFLDAVSEVFPENLDIATAKTGLATLQSLNPTAVHKMWYQQVTIPYRTEILEGNVGFFMEKDYTQDVIKMVQKSPDKDSGKIMEAIDTLRKNIRILPNTEQERCMKYIQNLTRITLLINEGK